jgi:hypothetical protein
VLYSLRQQNKKPYIAVELFILVNYEVLNWNLIKRELIDWYAVLKENSLFNSTTPNLNLSSGVGVAV